MGASRNKVYYFLDSMKFEFFKIKNVYTKLYFVMFHVNIIQYDYIIYKYSIIDIENTVLRDWEHEFHD